MVTHNKKQPAYLPGLFIALSSLTHHGLTIAAEDNELPTVVVKAKKESAIQLNAKTTTASRLGLTALETPASVETLDAETVKLRGDVSIREAVSRTTGFTDISNLGTGNAFSVRGFTGNNSVAQAEDGIRLLTAASTITYPSDTWGYDRFEVLRGSASVLFGDASVGGIINSIRKAPKRDYTLDALVSAGTQGAYRLGVGGTAPVGEVAALRIDASAVGGQGYVDMGRYNSQKLMTNLEINPGEKLKLNLIYDHGDENPTRYTGIPLRDGRIDKHLRDENYNVGDGIQHFVDDRLKAKLAWEISDTLQLTNTAYWFISDRHWRNVEYFSLNTVTQSVNRSGYTEIRHKQKQLGDQLILNGADTLWDRDNKWSIGYEVAKVNFQYFDNFYNGNDPSSTVDLNNSNPGSFQTIDPTVKDFSSETVQQSLFAEEAYKVTPQWTLSAGLRQDWIKIDHDSKLTSNDYSTDFAPFSYRFGTTYSLDDNTSVYGQWSRGSDPVSSIVTLRPSNGAFKLTSAQQAEIGLKHVLDNRKGEFTLAIYDITKDDIITRDPNNATLRVQGGQQSSRGVEFSASLLPAEHWRTDFNLAILDARFDKLLESAGGVNVSRAGNTPSDVPERVANAWLYYQQPDWQAGIGARLVGARYADNANTSRMPGYTVYDANIAWRANAHLTLRASLRNLSDKVYAPVSYDTQQFIIGESRRAEIRAEINY